ncbi:Zinc finger protein, partial [Pseudolycoriella hygida]
TVETVIFYYNLSDGFNLELILGVLYISQLVYKNRWTYVFNHGIFLVNQFSRLLRKGDEINDRECRKQIFNRILMLNVQCISIIIAFAGTFFIHTHFIAWTFVAYTHVYTVLVTGVLYFGGMLVIGRLYRILHRQVKISLQLIEKSEKLSEREVSFLSERIDCIASNYQNVTVYAKRFNEVFSIQLMMTFLSSYVVFFNSTAFLLFTLVRSHFEIVKPETPAFIEYIYDGGLMLLYATEFFSIIHVVGIAVEEAKQIQQLIQHHQVLMKPYYRLSNQSLTRSTLEMSVAVTLPTSSIQFRKAFHSANKQSNESVDDWYNRLENLARLCNYGRYLEVLLLDKLIVELDDTILDRLCTQQQQHLSLENVIEFSRKFEVNTKLLHIKPEVTTIKEELNLSDVELDDGTRSNSDDDYDYTDHNPDDVLNTDEPIVQTKSLVDDRPKVFECYLCHKSWPTVGHLTYHFGRHHTLGTITKCPLCGKWLKTPSSLVRHVNMHLSDRPYSCDLCDFSFASAISLKRHMVRHKECTSNAFECFQCQKTFISRRHLRLHRKTHDNPTKSLSEKLDEAVKIRESMKSNRIKMETKFVCEICAKPFDSEKPYDEHMKDHCENEWLCHLCGRKLKTKRNLINHYIVHSGEKPFTCDDCGKVFTCKDKLKLHLKIHKGIRPHVCLICNKAFIQKGHLATHSKSHIEKSFDFKCQQCPQQFTNRTRYELHLRSHSGYECGVCGKTFKKKYHRTDHMRTHTGERPYKCNLCEKSFTQRSALSGHLKWHTTPKLVKKRKFEELIQ